MADWKDFPGWLKDVPACPGLEKAKTPAETAMLEAEGFFGGKEVPALELDREWGDAFRIREERDGRVHIRGGETGLLYCALRMIQCWDNMDGTIERGYAGRSLWFENGAFSYDPERMRALGRLLASVGINCLCINNVNVREPAQGLIDEKLEDLGAFALPDVEWAAETALPVAAVRRAVALYCTHSDESYEPTDGKSSIEKRGGIYDVAESLKASLEKEGVTVYYSDENHYPHDAGAYRRSRATAASLAEEGVDAIFDVHRDGIPDASQYESTVDGENVTKVRLLVGRSNPNSSVNREFAKQLKAAADEKYDGLIKDIFIGKGDYNQEISSQSVLLEFGTHKSDKAQVLASTAFMADVLDRALYGGVTGAAGDGKTAAPKNSGGVSGVFWVIGLLIAGALVYAFAASGDRRLGMEKFKNTFREMTGGLLGGRKDGNGE